MFRKLFVSKLKGGGKNSKRRQKMGHRKITEMHITFVCDSKRKILEALLSGVRRACPGVLHNFHIRTLTHPRDDANPTLMLILRFYPHVYLTLDPQVLAHAIEHGMSYLRMHNDLLCPSVPDGAFSRIGTFNDITIVRLHGDEYIIETHFVTN